MSEFARYFVSVWCRVLDVESGVGSAGIDLELD